VYPDHKNLEHVRGILHSSVVLPISLNFSLVDSNLNDEDIGKDVNLKRDTFDTSGSV
jgi:hypothetical protein